MTRSGSVRPENRSEPGDGCTRPRLVADTYKEVPAMSEAIHVPVHTRTDV